RFRNAPHPSPTRRSSDLNLSVSGTTAINTDQVTTTGTQIYTGNVTLGLGAGSTVTLAGATVTTNGALSGGANNNNLTVTGNAVFGNAASPTTSRVSAVGNLSVSGTTTINTDQVTTTGTQGYTGNVTLAAST